MGRAGRKLEVCTECARKGFGKWHCVSLGGGKFAFRRACRYCGAVQNKDTVGGPVAFIVTRAQLHAWGKTGAAS